MNRRQALRAGGAALLAGLLPWPGPGQSPRPPVRIHTDWIIDEDGHMWTHGLRVSHPPIVIKSRDMYPRVVT